MIRHIFTIIWNERKSNTLIFLEFIIVFCVFWFCMDYLYYVGSRYYESEGYDIEHTYVISMKNLEKTKESKDDKYNYAMLLKSRLEQYPGVECVSFSSAAIPYGYSTMSRGYYINGDSVSCNIMMKSVTPEYFEVFRNNFVSGRNFSELDKNSDSRTMIISPDRNNMFRDEKGTGIPVDAVKEIKLHEDNEDYYTVVGIVEKQKRYVMEPYKSIIFMFFTRSNYDCATNEITIRVAPAANEGFADRFAKDMREQLIIGPYTFESISSLEERKESTLDYNVGENLKSVLAITLFLFINIFLGIIGTFWSRTESRKSEIGLRIAMGSSKRKVRWQMFAETMILLLLASVIGVYVCVNLGQSDLLQAVGIPLADYEMAGFGSGHYFVNYAITLLLLALISGVAVWYPSWLASKTEPAEALRAE
ncbi:ABC transporter permease [Bacteroides sp. 214]|uniref:ABC transporter permease n=1 Tax=Bacteroides sp. 214 TaxID=2302935 RepID=UPI0013D49CEA|nr:FtsX-like permease family protein [Bacteroides sp. 214]NDW13758.1 ABC transporter permease [Bacteroides sp. 214]